MKKKGFFVREIVAELLWSHTITKDDFLELEKNINEDDNSLLDDSDSFVVR